MPGRISFYLDEHVPPAVASGLRQRGADVMTARDAGMLGAPDEDHPALAVDSGRVVFTQDADFANGAGSILAMRISPGKTMPCRIDLACMTHFCRYFPFTGPLATILPRCTAR